MRRLADARGLTVERAVFAPTAPVHSTVERVQLETPATGRLAIVSRSAATTAGDAAGVGVPVPVERLGEADLDRPVVACATREWGYRDVAGLVNAAVDAGRRVVAVLTANDEAVLVSNRLRTSLPVVDDVDVEGLLSAMLVAVEVRQGTAPLQRLTDPFWLADAFGLDYGEGIDARAVADQLFDSVCAVVTLDGPTAEHVALSPQTCQAAVEMARNTARARVVHLADIAAQANSRRGSVVVDNLVMAAMGAVDATLADADALAHALGIPVTRIDSEAAAARVGALTTPGLTPGVVVVDVGAEPLTSWPTAPVSSCRARGSSSPPRRPPHWTSPEARPSTQNARRRSPPSPPSSSRTNTVGEGSSTSQSTAGARGGS